MSQARTATDPVCGMHVPADSPHRVSYGGGLFVFCSESCRERFAQAPDRYLVSTSADVATASPPQRPPR
jgi:Cu+-exporting ATPase